MSFRQAREILKSPTNKQTNECVEEELGMHFRGGVLPSMCNGLGSTSRTTTKMYIEARVSAQREGPEAMGSESSLGGKNKQKKQPLIDRQWGHAPLIPITPILGKQRQVDLCEFETAWSTK